MVNDKMNSLREIHNDLIKQRETLIKIENKILNLISTNREKISVQIGSNRGNDDFYDLVKNNTDTKLILVEPLKVHNKSLEECYSNFKNKYIENIIINDNPNERTSKIYYHKFDGLEYGNNYELASLNKQHSLNIRGEYSEEDLICEEIPSLTLNQLFEKYGIYEIDILCVDTEGYDEKIIKSIDFEKFKINEIYYENLHCNIDDLRNFLSEKGYSITPNVLLYGWSDKAKKISNENT
jgi:FkbM family methyltransferase